MAIYKQVPVQLESVASPLATECEAALLARGINVVVCASPTEDEEAADTDEPHGSDNSAGVRALVLEQVPGAKHAATLANRLAHYARGGMPPVVLIPLPVQTSGTVPARSGDEQAASLALLRARGAVIVRAPEVWLECVILLAGHGAPRGPQGAIVAEPKGWLAAAAAALQKRAETLGERFSPLAHARGAHDSTDFVLTDTQLDAGTRPNTKVMIIPVGTPSGNPEVAPRLTGLANALAAAEISGQASMRIAAGDGPASPADAPIDDIDTARFERQLGKLGASAGDHECKVLLSSYSVAITRQAVATTPSAATRIAKKAGYPVQIKAWGADQASEAEGALVLTDIATAADVRRAFSTVCAQTQCEAVIVRETPMSGREIRIHIQSMGAIGLVCFLYQRGRREPVAALAPLRPIDATSMARHVVASRSGDQDPDWAALASVLINASHMVAGNPRLLSVELSRVLVGNEGEGVLVVDARARLQPL